MYRFKLTNYTTTVDNEKESNGINKNAFGEKRRELAMLYHYSKGFK